MECCSHMEMLCNKYPASALTMTTVSPDLFLWNILAKTFIFYYRPCIFKGMQKCFMAHEMHR